MGVNSPKKMKVCCKMIVVDLVIPLKNTFVSKQIYVIAH